MGLEGRVEGEAQVGDALVLLVLLVLLHLSVPLPPVPILLLPPLTLRGDGGGGQR